MKMIIVVALAFVAFTVAAPPATLTEPAKIIRSQFDQQPEGSYLFGFESDDGILRTENGELKEVLDEEKKPHKVIVVRGSYTYQNVNGEPESINYYADESGYHAEGKSIPKAVSRR